MSGNFRDLQHSPAERHFLPLLNLRHLFLAENYLAVEATNPSVCCTTTAKHVSTSLASHVGATISSTLLLTSTFIALHILTPSNHC